MGDDGVGVFIARRLNRKHNMKHVVIADPHMLNISKVLNIFNPEKIIIFDAIDAGLNPGDIVFVNIKGIKPTLYTTHNIPIDLILKLSGLKIEVYILGIQISYSNICYGCTISSEVVKSARVLSDLIGQFFKSES